MAAIVDRVHHDIEVMTRQLELEKRRLHRLDKEVAAARRTRDVKVQQQRTASAKSRGRARAVHVDGHRPTSAGAATPRLSSLQGGGQDSEAGPAGLTGEDLEMLPAQVLLARLDLQQKKLDRARSETAELRRQIDIIRQDRFQLTSIFDEMKAQVRQTSSQLCNFFEELTANSSANEEVQQRMSALKRLGDAERTNFKKQVMKIRRNLQECEFQRKELEVQLKRGDGNVQNKKDLIQPEDEAGFSEVSMIQRIMKTAFLNCIQRRHIKQHQKNIAVFEQAFSTIKQSTGISNIEEIVRIFVNLESRNYSLLTYVNHMNREIEVLEGLCRFRNSVEVARRDEDENHERLRQQALGEPRRKLQAMQLAITTGQEACAQQHEVLQQLRVSLEQVAQNLSEELQHLASAAGPQPGSEAPRLPEDLREETIPEWLQWVERALGRFRDVMPTRGKELAFPATVADKVRHVPMKRQLGHPLVKLQELPTSVMPTVEELNNALQKRGAGGRPAQVIADFRAEQQEEEEDEDFDRPLPLKDIRARAEQAVARRIRRNAQKNVAPHSADELFAATAGNSSRPPSAAKTSPASLELTLANVLRRDSKASPKAAEPLADASSADNGSSTALDSSAQNVSVGQVADEDRTRSADEPAVGANALEGAGLGEVGKRSSRILHRSGKHKFRQVAEVSEEELRRRFLQRYSMTRQELEVLANRMGIGLADLCYLKEEFDHHDEDRSGYLASQELQGLLKRLGEDLSAVALARVLARLDADGSGEIEFFEFAEWFVTQT